MGQRMIEGPVNRLDQLVKRSVMARQEAEIVVYRHAVAQAFPGIPAVTDQHVLLRVAYFEKPSPMVLNEPGIYAIGLVSERLPLPKTATKAERAPGGPTMAGVAHLALAHDENGETIPADDCLLVSGRLYGTHRTRQKTLPIEIVIV